MQKRKADLRNWIWLIKSYKPISGLTKFMPIGSSAMFHHDAHLRLNACDGLRSVRRAETAGVRARPRNTDANSLFEKIGLADRVRKL